MMSVLINYEFAHCTNMYVRRAEELIPDFERIQVLLHSDGRLHWEPGGIFKTTCDIDIAFFPFDTQHCPLLIGAYSYYRCVLLLLMLLLLIIMSRPIFTPRSLMIT